MWGSDKNSQCKGEMIKYYMYVWKCHNKAHLAQLTRFTTKVKLKNHNEGE